MTRPAALQTHAPALGRYVAYGEIASGGMATVHYGRQLGHAGFTRTVAIKRMHPHCARDPDFVSMFLDEGRLAARIRHPNVVPILDVVSANHELWLVMDFVLGETLARALRAGRKIGRPPPVRVTSAILTGVLEGLHAAHEAVSEQGDPLCIVHRDVSPQNIMVGADGVARVLDFGIAKASVRLQTTRDGQLKGKLQYMAPEQILEQGVDRRTDVFSASVVLWEALAGRRLFEADSEPAIMRKVLEEPIPSVREVAKDVPEQLACVVDQGLRRNPDDRFQSAQAMAIAIEHAAGVATPREVAAWLSDVASEAVTARSADVAEIESQSMSRDLLSVEADAQADLAAASSRRSESATLSDLPSWDGNSGTLLSSTRNKVHTGDRKRWAMGIALTLLAGIGVAATVGIASRSSSPSVPVQSTRRDDPSVVSTPSLPAIASTMKETIAPPASSSAPTREQPPRPAGSRGAPPLKGPGPRALDCSEPFVIHPDGVRVPKPECL